MERTKNMDQQEQKELTEAQAYVNANIIPTQLGRACVDGRYVLAGEQSGRTARPGADAGYVMILLGLKEQGKIDLSAKECVNLVFKFVTKDGDKFRLHTDDHAIHAQKEAANPLITGCGHEARAMKDENAELYQINPEDLKEALLEIDKLKATGLVQEAVLPGDHAEKGVIVNTGRKNTLNHSNKDEQYFVYDQEQDHDFMHQLYEGLNLPDVTFDDFKAVAKRQTDATLELLAKGKPVFIVDTDEGGYNSKVSFAGRV